MAAIHDTVQIGLKISLPVLRICFPERWRETHGGARSGIAGIIDEHRDRAQRLFGSGHSRLHRVVIADISRRGHGWHPQRPDFLDHGVSAFSDKVIDRNTAGVVVCKCQRHGAPGALAARAVLEG